MTVLMVLVQYIEASFPASRATRKIGMQHGVRCDREIAEGRLEIMPESE